MYELLHTHEPYTGVYMDCPGSPVSAQVFEREMNYDLLLDYIDLDEEKTFSEINSSISSYSSWRPTKRAALTRAAGLRIW